MAASSARRVQIRDFTTTARDVLVLGLKADREAQRQVSMNEAKVSVKVKCQRVTSTTVIQSYNNLKNYI